MNAPSRLLVFGVCSFLLAAAFGGGFELAQLRGAARHEQAIMALEVRQGGLVAERDALAGELASLRQQLVVLGRNQQIDREAARILRDELKEAQDARLELAKELSYLTRVVQDGSRGVVRAHDLRLARGESPRDFQYAFTLTQLVHGFGDAEGEVRLSVEGRKAEEPLTLSLEDLPNAEPQHLSMAFEHFQHFSGRLEIPQGFEPDALVIDIVPTNEELSPITESFPWSLDRD